MAYLEKLNKLYCFVNFNQKLKLNHSLNYVLKINVKTKLIQLSYLDLI